MSDLVTFILARLDKDEAAARAVAEEHWDDCPTWVDARTHILRHDPPRVLAEVAAKRRIIHQAENLAEYVDATREHEAYRYEPVLHRLLAPLAQPYADHTDFDPAWRV